MNKDRKMKEAIKNAVDLAVYLIIKNMDYLTIDQFNNLHNAITERIRAFAREQEEAYKAHEKSQEFVSRKAQLQNYKGDNSHDKA